MGEVITFLPEITVRDSILVTCGVRKRQQSGKKREKKGRVKEEGTRKIKKNKRRNGREKRRD
jgi:hypothetical protein